jgi:hypothetical protein
MTKPTVKTYATPEPKPDEGLPKSLFDPRWNQPDVASRVAFVLSRRLPSNTDAQLGGALALPPELTESRTFKFVDEHTTPDGVRVKGGSYGELHRHVSFGSQPANFHAQAVAFGVESSGRFFLVATVGRFDGPWGNEGTLAATFKAGKDVVGSASWKKFLDPVGDHRVVVVGKDVKIAARFDEIDSALVQFCTRTGVEAPPEDKPPPLSRARKSVLQNELKAALALNDEAEKKARVRKALTNVNDDDARAMLSALAKNVDEILSWR